MPAYFKPDRGLNVRSGPLDRGVMITFSAALRFTVSKAFGANMTKRHRTFFNPRKWIIYQPLALALAILMALPAASWFQPQFGNSRVPKPFQASAQAGSGLCTGTHILNNFCLLSADAQALETDAVSSYLTLHNLAPTEAANLYSLGREDLRTEIRGLMLARLESIIMKPSAQRTTQEANQYYLLQYGVQQNEVALYTQELAAFHQWQSNPCQYQLDSTVAQAYSLTYDGTPYCYPLLTGAFGGPPAPAESYFSAYGFQKSYGALAASNPIFPAIVSGTGAQAGIAFGAVLGTIALTALPGAILVFTTTGAYLASVSAAAVLSAAGGSEAVAAGLALINAAFGSLLIPGGAASTLGAFGAAAGPIAILLIAAAIGVQAGLEVFNSAQTIRDLNNVNNLLANAQNNLPDLSAYLNDGTGVGLYKLTLTLVSQTNVSGASTVALPHHQFGVDASALVASTSGSALQNAFVYQDSTNLIWTAATAGGWFVRNCISTSGCPPANSFSASFDFIDWSGVKWNAGRFGNKFVVTKIYPAATDVSCPVSTVTGFSTAANVNICKSYVSASVPLVDDSNNRVTVSLVIPPNILNQSSLSATAGIAQTLTFQGAGSVPPSISFVSGLLPANANFTSGTGTATLTIGAASPVGSYAFTLAATYPNGENIQKSFILTLQNSYSLSPVSFTPDFAIPFSYTITSSGGPAGSLAISPGFLPSTVTFTDNHNGTATLAGTLAQPGLIGCDPVAVSLYCNGSITLTPPQGAATKFPIALYNPVLPQFLANVLSATTANFTVGQPNAVVVRDLTYSHPAAGWDLSVLFRLGSGPQPWLKSVDNGDGTISLSGTPPRSAVGQSYPLNLVPFYAPGVDGSVPFAGNFTLSVVNGPPVFTSSATASYTVGTNTTNTITTDVGVPQFVSTNAPDGSLFDLNNDTNIVLRGIPTQGQGGQYSAVFNASNSAGASTQNVTVLFYEPPTITSPNYVHFWSGVAKSFNVSTFGFPSTSAAPIVGKQSLPTTPAQGLISGMNFQLPFLPPGFTGSNLNAAHYATGTLVISATPGNNLGTYPEYLTATNGVGTNARQLLTFFIGGMPGDVTLDGRLDCSDYTFVKNLLKPGNQAVILTDPAFGNGQGDANDDGVIDTKDLTFIATHLPKGTVCH